MSTEILDPEIHEETEQDIQPAKGWVVVVHNDDHHTFQYVIECLCQIVMLSASQALMKAFEIHEEGQAVVTTPSSRYEAQEIANKIARRGPDPYGMRPKENVGLKTSVEEV